MSGEPHGFVSRGGVKLDHALSEFNIDATGLVCADFGANVGGFTDCLLQRGAARVYAIDTNYGTLAWKLRNDERVVVMERGNALHSPRPESAGDGVALVAIDLGWTPQRLAVPAAASWLAPEGVIISLIKPHYELRPEEKGLLRGGVLEQAEAGRVTRRACEELKSAGFEVGGLTRSPILGGASRRRKPGNAEWLALIRPGV